MKKILYLIISIGLLLVLTESCKKDNTSQAEPEKYRLIKGNFYGEEGYIKHSNYSFTADKITYRNSQDGSGQYLASYFYENEKVIAAVQIYEDSILERESSLEYVYENDKLVKINSWKKNVNDSVINAHFDFIYEGDKLVEYIEYNYSTPYSKSICQYENDQLTMFTQYSYVDDKWGKWYVDEFNYKGDKLDEVNTSIALFELDNLLLLTKMVYQYANDLPDRINIYIDNEESWELRYFVDHQYDQKNNLIKKEHKYSNDSTLMYYFDYQYEEGSSNLEELIYMGFIYDERLEYPKPNAVMTDYLMKKILNYSK